MQDWIIGGHKCEAYRSNDVKVGAIRTQQILLIEDIVPDKPPSATNANTLSDGTDGGTVSDDSESEIETIIRGVTSTRTTNRVNTYCCNINNIKLKKNNSNTDKKQQKLSK